MGSALGMLKFIINSKQSKYSKIQNINCTIARLDPIVHAYDNLKMLIGHADKSTTMIYSYLALAL